MAVLIVGGLLVAALVVWALTRTVEPDTTTATATFAPVAADTAVPTATGQITPTETSASVPPAAPVPHPEGNRAEVKRIAAEDLRAQLGRNEVTVIDVRTAADYARGHIPGAINIPFASIETQFDTIPKEKPIVTYCT